MLMDEELLPEIQIFAPSNASVPGRFEDEKSASTAPSLMRILRLALPKNPKAPFIQILAPSKASSVTELPGN